MFLKPKLLISKVYFLLICWLNQIMSAEYKFEDHLRNQEEIRSQSKVKLTDLLSRINEEKKIERNRNLALSIAAVSAVTVFGIILTL